MIGFTFNGKHSSQYNIGVRSIERSAIPERRKNEFTILGKSGTLELESTEYEKRKIECEIGLMKIDEFTELRKEIREVAKWLSGTGQLIFDDEPDKAYQASVYSAVGIEQIKLQPKGTMEIEFECQPFAESTDLHRLLTNGVNYVTVNLENKGNVKTCGSFIIKNIGSTPITNIQIKRKVVI